jgi:hypothetical protein
VYFVAIWQIFCRFGKLNREKSGNPVLGACSFNLCVHQTSFSALLSALSTFAILLRSSLRLQSLLVFLPDRSSVTLLEEFSPFFLQFSTRDFFLADSKVAQISGQLWQLYFFKNGYGYVHFGRF